MLSGSESSISLFGLTLRRETMDEAVAAIEKVIAERSPTIHVVLNAGKVSKMAKDAAFRDLMAAFDMVHADGASVVAASRLVGDPLPERIAGIDLMERLVALAAERGYRPFFLGARPEIVKLCVETLQVRHPDLHVAGYRDGYWKGEREEAEVVRDIRESGADLLFVAVPTPTKEMFLTRHRDALGVPFAMGVGGAFDVVAGLVKRAPEAWQRAGMEWLYRVFQEPRRMWKRYLVTNSHFLWLLGREVIRARARRGGRRPPSDPPRERSGRASA
jgi:N-acetylglucosaminyldiphosphoundecaprenol N-acetyl-beta-D-mannosaminyltransferase